MIGVNLYARFLVRDADKERAAVADVVRHIEHVAEIGGRGCVALGSDADSGFGGDMMPQGLERPEGWMRMAEALSGRGWSDGEVAGFMHGNWERVLG